MASSSNQVNRRSFLGRAVKASSAAAVGVGLYAWRVEPHWIEVTHRQLPLEGLDPASAGKRIVQISDLHVGPVVSGDYLRSAIRTVASLQPDAVFVTGDWMTCEGSEHVADAVEMARPLPDIGPVFGVLGNHDYGKTYLDPEPADRLFDGLSEVGITMLRNDHVLLDGVQIAGVDDLWSRRCQLASTIRRLDPGLPAIMLNHNPDLLDQPGWGGFRGWVLSGHTHGGQCRCPGFGAPVLPIDNARYTAGEVDLGDGRRLYVNRALGYKHRVRVLRSPRDHGL